MCRPCTENKAIGKLKLPIKWDDYLSRAEQHSKARGENMYYTRKDKGFTRIDKGFIC